MRTAMLVGLVAAGAFAQAPSPPRFSAAPAGAVPPAWQHLLLAASKQPTEYSLVGDDGIVVLRASSRNAASFLAWRTDYDARAFPWLVWRWKVVRPIAGADTRDRKREDAPARVMVSFAGDWSKLPATDRATSALAEAISGHPLPYAWLMYVWGARVARDSVTVSALTPRIRMIAVASDEDQAGRWLDYRRNIADDFRRAFGEEPGRVTAIELMTDTDNTGSIAEALYGDISIAPAR